MKEVTTIVVLVILSLATSGFAVETKVAPKADSTPQALEEASQHAKVISVKSPATYQNLVDKTPKWEKLKVGDKLGGLCLIRTGFGGKVELEFADRGRWVVKSCTKFGIQEYAKKAGHVKVRLGLKYGYIKGDIDSSKGTNDFQVKTAVATLAATGTGVNLGYTSDRGMGAHGTHGSWRMRTAQGNRNLTTGQRTDGNRTLSSFILMRMLAAGLSPLGATGIEQWIVDTNSDGRGLLVVGGDDATILPPPPAPTPPRRVPIPSPKINSGVSSISTN